MKNILILLPNDELGGAEQYLKMISSYFCKRDYTMHVYFWKRKITGLWENKSSDCLKLHYTKAAKERIGLPILIYSIIKNRKINFDYVFTSHVHCTTLVGVLKKIGILKINHFVARESTSIFKRFLGLKLLIFKMYYHLGYSAIDLLICQTEYMKNQLKENLPWMEKKVNIQVIPNPVNINNMAHKSKGQLSSNVYKPYIISAGRLINEKGYDILIKAFMQLKQNHVDFKLVILGEGKQREFLTQLITELQLEKDVILYGLVENVYPFFKQAQMCVVSSRIEGFPNVLLQMMSQNEKVVSTLCAGGIEDIEGLFTCPANDENALFEAMKKCLKSDTQKCRQLFDNELQSRSIDEFVNKVNSYLNP